MKFKLVEEFEKLDEGMRFANFIKDDLIDRIDSNPKLVTDNSVKCSYSAIPNALKFVNDGENVVLHVGNMNEDVPSLCSHVWVEHNDKVVHTNVPRQFNGKLFPNISIKLIPNDIEGSKKLIIDTLNKY